MKSPVFSVPPHSKIADLADHPGWRSFRLLPVADGNSLFHGVLKFETLSKMGRSGAGESPARNTGKALGELYGVGLQALFRSTLGGVWKRESE
jgi:hypothetical protein